MNILITGCAGFIGSHTVDYFLEDKNYFVVGLDKLTYASNMSNLDLALESSRFEFIKGNICDSDLIEQLVKEKNIGCILNFAAETHVDNSIRDASSFIDSNVHGVYSLLEVSRKTKCLLFHVSTDEVYGVANNVSFIETDSLNPKNPYSATKAAAEHLIKSHQNTFGIPYLMVRPSNNFGPRQHQEKFMPTILRSLQSSNKIPIYGDGNQVREWTYVKDTAKAIKYILENSELNNCYNVSSNVELQNIDLVRTICQVTSNDFQSSIKYVEDRLGHDFRYSIDNSKLEKLGFEDYAKFEESLLETVKSFGVNE